MQLKQARTPPGLAPEDTDPHSAAEAVGAVDCPSSNRRSSTPDRAPNNAPERRPSPSNQQRRTARPGRPPSASLGVGQYVARSKPAAIRDSREAGRRFADDRPSDHARASKRSSAHGTQGVPVGRVAGQSGRRIHGRRCRERCSVLVGSASSASVIAPNLRWTMESFCY